MMNLVLSLSAIFVFISFQSLFVKIPLDALLRCLFKFFLLDFYCRQLAIYRHFCIESLSVLLHNVVKVFFREAHGFHFVIIRMHYSYKFFTALHDNALVYNSHGVKLVFNFLWINVLTIGSKKHIL